MYLREYVYLLGWIYKEGLNCYDGHGAINIDPEPFSTGMTATECILACHTDPECEGVVRKSSSQEELWGVCYKRKNIYYQECDQNTEYSLYLGLYIYFIFRSTFVPGNNTLYLLDPIPYVFKENGEACGATKIATAAECSIATGILGFKTPINSASSWDVSPEACITLKSAGKWHLKSYFNTSPNPVQSRVDYRCICHKGKA